MSVKSTTSCDVASKGMRMWRCSLIRGGVCLRGGAVSSFSFGSGSKPVIQAQPLPTIPSASARPRPIRRVSAGNPSVIAIPSAAHAPIASGNRSYG